MNPYTILAINAEIIMDPVLLEIMKRVFVWANEVGLQGMKTTDLRFIEPNIKENPLATVRYMVCEIEKREDPK